MSGEEKEMVGWKLRKHVEFLSSLAGVMKLRSSDLATFTQLTKGAKVCIPRSVTAQRRRLLPVLGILTFPGVQPGSHEQKRPQNSADTCDV